MVVRHKIHKWEGELTEIQNCTPTVKNFVFEVPEGFDFTPGQFVTAIIPVEGLEKPIRRSYSIASSPRKQGSMDLCIKLVENGPGSTHFFKMKQGEKLSFIGPMGLFVLKEKDQKQDIVFIATGTGIAPFRSMAQSVLPNGYKNNMTLLTGVRYEEEVLFPEELKQLEKKHSNFTWKSIVSRPKQADYPGEKGRVQQLVDQYVPEPQDFKGSFYLCGLSPMINQTQQQLLEKGFPKENIHFEKYD
jgi:ferredoxin-NADP reductase